MASVSVLNADALDNYRAKLEDTLDASAVGSGKNRKFEKVLIELENVMAYMQLEMSQLYRNCANLEDRIRKSKNRELVAEHKSAKKWVPLVIMGCVSAGAAVIGGGAALKGGEKAVLKGLMDIVQGVNKGAEQGYQAYDKWSDGTKTQLQSEIESLRKKSDDMTNYESQSHSRQTDMIRKAEEIEAASTRAFSSAAGA